MYVCGWVVGCRHAQWTATTIPPIHTYPTHATLPFPPQPPNQQAGDARVRAVAVNPGAVATDIWRFFPEEAREK